MPGLRGQVPRFKRLHYRGFDPYGQAFEREVEGFHARVVQHECDHLDGTLFIDRAEDVWPVEKEQVKRKNAEKN